MQKVEAYLDNTGRLHKHRRDAIEAEFTQMIRDAWACFPGRSAIGDPDTIAEHLMSSIYPLGRKKLMDALLYAEEHRYDGLDAP